MSVNYDAFQSMFHGDKSRPPNVSSLAGIIFAAREPIARRYERTDGSRETSCRCITNPRASWIQGSCSTYIYATGPTVQPLLYFFMAICCQMLLRTRLPDGNVTVFTARVTIPRLIIGHTALCPCIRLSCLSRRRCVVFPSSRDRFLLYTRVYVINNGEQIRDKT